MNTAGEVADSFAKHILAEVDNAKLRLNLVLSCPVFEKNCDINFLARLKQLRSFTQQLQHKQDTGVDCYINNTGDYDGPQNDFRVKVSDSPHRWQDFGNSCSITNALEVYIRSCLSDNFEDDEFDDDDVTGYNLEHEWDLRCMLDTDSLTLKAILFNRETSHHNHKDDEEQGQVPSDFREQVLRYVLYPSTERQSEVFTQTRTYPMHENNQWTKLRRILKGINESQEGVFWAPFSDMDSGLKWALKLVKWWSF